MGVRCATFELLRETREITRQNLRARRTATPAQFEGERATRNPARRADLGNGCLCVRLLEKHLVAFAKPGSTDGLALDWCAGSRGSRVGAFHRGLRLTSRLRVYRVIASDRKRQPQTGVLRSGYATKYDTIPAAVPVCRKKSV